MITRPGDFYHILKQGRIDRGRLLLIASLPGDPRVGFTTPRGLLAVERNRLKRWLRELWRHRSEAMQDRQVVLQIRAEALKQPFSALQNEFNELINRHRAMT